MKNMPKICFITYIFAVSNKNKLFYNVISNRSDLFKQRLCIILKKEKGMKKIVLLVLFAVAVYTNSFALELNDYKVFCKLNNEVTLNSLSRYLNVSDEQRDQLRYLFELTESKVKSAIYKTDEEAAEKALYFNLGNAKYILSEEQYKKYLVVLNLTVFGNEEVLLAEK